MVAFRRKVANQDATALFEPIWSPLNFRFKTAD
jgi:hypothetical protein